MHRLPLAWLVGLACAACVLVNPAYDGGSASQGEVSVDATSVTSTSAASTDAASTSAASTASESASVSATATSTSTASTSASTASASTAGASSTQADTSTGEPFCPAVAAISSVFTDDPACAACLDELCCDPFTACAGGCADALACALGESCVIEWSLCPGFDGSEALLRNATQCMNNLCYPACNLGPCAGPTTACKRNPECVALESCVVTCSALCDPRDGPCPLQCVAMCKQQHPDGVTDYDNVWKCIGAQCQ